MDAAPSSKPSSGRSGSALSKASHAPYERALYDFFEGARDRSIVVHSSLGEHDDLPVALFFRGSDEFFPFERAAMELCRGRVLDAGAGTGVHALELQKRGFEVRAVEILPGAAAIMAERGVRDVVYGDMFDLVGERYDTVLMLMNGIGPVGTLEGLDRFLSTASRLLLSGGQILVDSGQAVTIEPPRGPYATSWPRNDGYVGEAWIRLEYDGHVGDPFRELYLDEQTFSDHARRHGWNFDVVFQDETGGYLARLSR